MTQQSEFAGCFARPFKACLGPAQCDAYQLALATSRQFRQRSGITPQEHQQQMEFAQQAAQFPVPEAGMVKAAMGSANEHLETVAQQLGVPCRLLKNGE